MSDDSVTVGELVSELESFGKNTKILFAGGLRFYRIKRVSDDEIFFEFDEAEAYLEDSFRERHPDVKVAFLHSADVLQGGDGPVRGPIDVSLR